MKSIFIPGRFAVILYPEANMRHYLPLNGMVNIPIYLSVWASWVRNETTFLSDNCYFDIET